MNGHKSHFLNMFFFDFNIRFSLFVSLKGTKISDFFNYFVILKALFRTDANIINFPVTYFIFICFRAVEKYQRLD